MHFCTQPESGGDGNVDDLIESGSLKSDQKPAAAMSDADRKSFVKQRWINAFNKVRDQINQVRPPKIPASCLSNF